MSDKPTPLQDRLGSMVHAFSDEQRKYAVRLLAADVGKVERELQEANERVKRLEAAGDLLAEWHLAVVTTREKAERDVARWNEAKETKP